MTLKTRLSKLENNMFHFYQNPTDRVVSRHVEKRPLDKLMLIDTMTALLIKDDPDHPKCGFAKAFLDWASTRDFRLIERAERIYQELVAAKCWSESPVPWTATAVDPNKVQPPYPCYCTAEQLDKCPKHPFGW